MASPTPEDEDAAWELTRHLDLLTFEDTQGGLQELTTTPIFTMPVMRHAQAFLPEDSQQAFPQYGLLAGMTDLLRDGLPEEIPSMLVGEDPRVFLNTNAPSSTFICGSQGSGKSHTLSCMLENCLIPSDACNLPEPLAGLVFHYDTFISDEGGSPCEAAYLSSDPKIKRTYHALDVEVEALQIKPRDLNTKRMLDLMAVSKDDGPMPLYLHTIYRILREMRTQQQETGGEFDYQRFKRQTALAGLTPGQLGPLTQRLDTLESFMSAAQREVAPTKGRKSIPASSASGNDWSHKPGYLTIVDLSCPCVTPEGACSLFNICLGIFLEQSMNIGRVIALDEAHKFMNASGEASAFTNTLLSTIRLQRHLNARIIISTQEPTISPALLDLSSSTIVHRFTSPEWFHSLKRHLAAAASDLLPPDGETDRDDNHDGRFKGKDSVAKRIFDDVVKLRVGEALLFSPSAMVALDTGEGGDTMARRLGAGYLKIRVRARVTADGGKSVMAC